VSLSARRLTLPSSGPAYGGPLKSNVRRQKDFMDTAIVVIRDAEADALKRHLTLTLPGQSDPWLIRGIDGPVAFVNLAPADDADLEPQELNELKRRLSSEQLLAVLIDVRIRNLGCSEVRSFVTNVLERFHGLASDDLLEHWWKADELRNPSLIGGRIFWPHEARQSGGVE